MSLAKAKAYFSDKGGSKKLNCAQAVIAAFREKFGLDENAVHLFASFGSGRAPEGECGALYAAKFILDGRHRDKAEECRNIFISKAGSVKCKEIRQLKKLSCVGCVETAAEFLDKIEENRSGVRAMKNTFNVKQFIAGSCYSDKNVFVSNMRSKAIPKPFNIDNIIRVNQKGQAVALEMISPKAAHELISKDPAVKLLDVRSALEFNEAHIKDSVNIPIDMLSAKLNEIGQAGQSYIVLCRTGNRSPMAADMLIQSGISSVKVMDGGITGWQKDKLAVIKGVGGISLERQVRIIAGSLVLAGILLSILVNRWFLGISLFVACGLIYAGLTDNCMMGMLLMKLPYNKKL